VTEQALLRRRGRACDDAWNRRCVCVAARGQDVGRAGPGLEDIRFTVQCGWEVRLAAGCRLRVRIVIWRAARRGRVPQPLRVANARQRRPALVVVPDERWRRRIIVLVAVPVSVLDQKLPPGWH
jgi:hypothetical protein